LRDRNAYVRAVMIQFCLTFAHENDAMFNERIPHSSPSRPSISRGCVRLRIHCRSRAAVSASTVLPALPYRPLAACSRYFLLRVASVVLCMLYVYGRKINRAHFREGRNDGCRQARERGGSDGRGSRSHNFFWVHHRGSQLVATLAGSSRTGASRP